MLRALWPALVTHCVLRKFVPRACSFCLFRRIAAKSAAHVCTIHSITIFFCCCAKQNFLSGTHVTLRPGLGTLLRHRAPKGYARCGKQKEKDSGSIRSLLSAFDPRRSSDTQERARTLCCSPMIFTQCKGRVRVRKSL